MNHMYWPARINFNRPAAHFMIAYDPEPPKPIEPHLIVSLLPGRGVTHRSDGKSSIFERLGRCDWPRPEQCEGPKL